MPFSYRRLPLAYNSGFMSLITLLVLVVDHRVQGGVLVSGDESKTTAYVDPDTMRRNGDLVKMWTL